MKLRELISGIKNSRLRGSDDVEISSIEYDSRRVKKGSLFVAITGLRTDGRRFVNDAVVNGAAAISSESVENMPDGIPLIEVQDSRQFLAEASARLTGYPDHEMTIVGVTGTNGKTTVTYLLEKIFKASDLKTGIIGTTGFYYGGAWQKLSHTTPESSDLWEMLLKLRQNECKAVAMEISSHAIALKRAWGLDIDAAIFTNLTQDHLDFHKNIEDYKGTKFRLFEGLKNEAIAVINIDDPCGMELAERLEDSRTVTCSVETEEADLWIEIEESSLAGSGLVIHYGGLALPVFLNLPGLHNASNLAVASAAALSLEIDPECVRRGTEELRFVPGRMEPVPNARGFCVLVDYAHTPDALEHLISAAKSLSRGRVITLFGCGGDRDRTKRSLMGRIASELSDFVFVTSDNPRTEDPREIISEILQGVHSEQKAVIPDRREAIFEAVRSMKAEDVLLIAGKGHEDYQILGAEKVHFDDREVAKEALDALP